MMKFQQLILPWHDSAVLENAFLPNNKIQSANFKQVSIFRRRLSEHESCCYHVQFSATQDWMLLAWVHISAGISRKKLFGYFFPSHWYWCCLICSFYFHNVPYLSCFGGLWAMPTMAIERERERERERSNEKQIKRTLMLLSFVSKATFISFDGIMTIRQ